MSVANKITLNHLKYVVHNLFTIQKPVPLGRWNTHKNNQLGLIIHYSNEDHCGTCAQYIQIKRNEQKEEKQNLEKDKIYSDEYIWLLSHTQD